VALGDQPRLGADPPCIGFGDCGFGDCGFGDYHVEGASTVNSSSASVVFITAHYDLHCSMTLRSGRAFDVFNDHTTRFLELENVRYCPHLSGESICDVQRALLVKDNVQLALLVSEDRSNASRVFYAAQAKRILQAVITLPTAMVTGLVHMKSANDAHGFLSIEAASFIPVTNAQLIGSPGAAAVESPVAMVKKDAITSFALVNRPS